MNTYFALVHKDADSAYGISFPDLPGCFSAADDEDEVFVQAQAALSLYVSDEQMLPAARSVSQLRADPHVAAEIAGGAYVIAVPLIVVSRKLRYNLMLGSELVEAVDFTARAVGVSRSEFVSEAIGDRLREHAGAVLLRQGTGKHVGLVAYSGVKKAASKSAKETTGKKVASAAAKILKSKTASKAAKSVAASALTQKVKAKKAAKKK